MAAILLPGALPIILDTDVVGRVASLHGLADGPNPYFVVEHALLLYVRAPLVVMSACMLVLAPGLILVRATAPVRSMAVWVVSGLMLSLVVVSAAAAAAELVSPGTLAGGDFVSLLVVLSLASLLLLWVRLGRRPELSQPLADPAASAILGGVVGSCYLLLVLLAPKFYWDSFNGDGAHAFESARLLLHQPLPFWSPDAGAMASFPGVTSMLYAFPASWFIRLFGESEVSIRLPWALYMPALMCGIVAVAAPAGRRVRPLEVLLILAGLAGFALAMAFSATYSPYWADIALPATQDTLLVVCFLAYVHFFVTQRIGWMSLALVLVYVSLPNGLMLVLLWIAASLTWGRRPRRMIGWSLGILAVCVGAGAALAVGLPLIGLPAPGGEYGVRSLVDRFSYLQATDVRRLLYLFMPAGFLPALSLLLWRTHDDVGRSLSLVALGYFLLFYLQTFVVLHHFVPAMLLPLVVMWRLMLQKQGRAPWPVYGAIAAGATLAVVISFPRSARPHTASRQVGLRFEDRTGGYSASSPAAFRRSALLARVIPRDWDIRVPRETFRGSPLTWLYYANHRAGEHASNYVLQLPADPAPAGAMRVGADADAAVFVKSKTVWIEDLARRPPAPSGSPVYDIARGVRFRTIGGVDVPPTLSLPLVARRLGLGTGLRVLKGARK